MLDALLNFDRWLFGLLHGTWHQPWLDALMPHWRDKKMWIPVYVLILGFFIYKYRRNFIWPVLQIALSAGLADILSSRVFKPLFARTRPCRDEALSEVYRALMDCSSGYSFTSSHAANHFALSLAFWLILKEPYPRKRLFLLLFFWAGSIAYGQVYVGVHYPLDVFCGALLGLATAGAVHALIGQRLPFRT